MSGAADRDAWTELLPRDPIRFAPDFQWGVAASAFQAEGATSANFFHFTHPR